MAVAVGSLALVGGSGAYATFDQLGRHVSVQSGGGLFALLGLRSPGGRRSEGLLQSKPGHVHKASLRSPSIGGASTSEAPSERVLAAVRERPPEAIDAPAISRFAPSSPGVLDLPSTPGGVSAPPSPFGSPFDLAGPSFSPGVLPGSFEPLPSTGGPSSPAGPPAETGPSAVPEPETWAMMILGVFAVGALMRRGCALDRHPRGIHG